MLTKLRTIFSPPVFADDPEKTRTAQFLNIFFLLAMAVAVLYPLVSYLTGGPLGLTEGLLTFAVGAASLVLSIVLRNGHVQLAGIIISFVGWLVLTLAAYNLSGLHSPALTGYFFILILISLVARGRILFVFTGLLVLSAVGIFIAEHAGYISQPPSFPSDRSDVVFLVLMIITSGLLSSAGIRRYTSALVESRATAARIEEINLQMQERNQELAENQARLDQQTQQIERQTHLLQAAAEVGRAVNTILDPAELLDQVVNLIQQSFNLYYVGIFTPDDRGEWAVLRSGTGEAGQKMLSRDHRIRIGEGMVGWSIANLQPRIASEAIADDVRLATDELPETRSEAAIPLMLRGQALGAFTVQDRQSDAFDQTAVEILQNMADQVATALDNARLFTESQEALESTRRAFGEASGAAWQNYLAGETDINYISTQHADRQVPSGGWQPSMAETYNVGDITRPDHRTLHIPIILRDQVLGVVRLQKREQTGTWSDTEIELMDTLVDQLETALESARLYSDTQRQADRERLTHEVTNKLHRALDMDSLMQTMLQEISDALGASGAFVQLNAGDEPSNLA